MDNTPNPRLFWDITREVILPQVAYIGQVKPEGYLPYLLELRPPV